MPKGQGHFRRAKRHGSVSAASDEGWAVVVFCFLSPNLHSISTKVTDKFLMASLTCFSVYLPGRKGCWCW